MNESISTPQSTNRSTTDVVICGAGIAGISAAYHLSVRHGLAVVLVDERSPLSLTSDKSTEAYRNWWVEKDGAMLALMNRSIDLLETVARETDNRIRLNRRGYVYATADPVRVTQFRQMMALAETLDAGEMRIHTGNATDPPYSPAHPHNFENQPGGADLITDPALIRHHFPYLNEKTIAVLHARRCGWFSGYQLGRYLLREARTHGAILRTGTVTAVAKTGGRVTGVTIAGAAGRETIATRNFVNAAGPFLRPVGALMGEDLPVFSELHLKIAIQDRLGIIPRDAPLTIWADPQYLPWTVDERAFLAESPETRRMLNEFPGTLHFRPEGGGDSPVLLILFPYHTGPVPEIFPLPIDPDYFEIAMRGMVTMVPAMRAYLRKMPKPTIDGGYYTKTKENRPLIGPLSLDGAYVIGALAGYGLMASLAAGELLAAYVGGTVLPAYAPYFHPNRYTRPEYQKLLADIADANQL